MLALAVVLSAAAAAAPDPWAPGAAMEPWPLIERLQGERSLGADADAWRQALSHPDPLVRAAAAWAAGRTKPPGISHALAPLVTDADLLVRDAALWGALQIDDRDALDAIVRALRVRRDLGMGGRPRPGDPGRRLDWLIVRRGLFVGFVEERRAWLDRIDLATIRPLPLASPTRTGLAAMTWWTPRTEWDADERAAIHAALRTVASQEREALALRTELVALDAPPPDPNALPGPPRLAVELRRTDTPPADSIRLEGAGIVTLDLSLALHDLPPGPYLLDPLGPGHPLLLRVRRSPRREAEVQRDAAAAETAAEIDAAGLYRVASAAPRFRERFRAMLAPPRVIRGRWTPEPVFWSLAAALGRMGDAPAAGMLIGALSTMPVAYRPVTRGWGEDEVRADDPLVTRFGAAALPHLARAAGWWPKDYEIYGAQRFALSALRSSAGGANLDAARIDHLRDVVRRLPERNRPLPNVSWADTHDMELYKAAWIGIATRHPEVAGEALGALAGRPRLFEWALDLIDPHVAFSYPPPPLDVDVIERILRAAWSMLLPGAAEARAMIAGEAVRLWIAWPETRDALPTAETAVREARRVNQRAPEAARAALDRILASGLAAQRYDVATAAAWLALGLEYYEEGERLAETAVRLAPAGRERGYALLARARARQWQGDPGGQRADLVEAQTLLGGLHDEDRRTLNVLRASPEASRVRVRPRTWRFGRWGEPAGDGSVLIPSVHGVVRRDLVTGGSRLLAAAPFPVRALARVDADRVAVAGEDGRVALLRRGAKRPDWVAETKTWCDRGASYRCGAIAAGARVVVVRDSALDVRALDVRSGRALWTRPAGESVPLAVVGDEPVVLAGVPGPPTRIEGVDPGTGVTRWSVAVDPSARAWRRGPGRLAWLERGGLLRVLDTGSGGVADVELSGADAATAGGAVALAPSGTIVYAAVGGGLFAMEAGQVLWRRTIAAGSAFQLEAGDALWLLTSGTSARVVTVMSPDGEPIATHTIPLGGPAVLLDARTLEVPAAGDGSELLALTTPAR